MFLDSNKKYYVYAHSKPNGEVFYIGKGSGDRLNKTGNRSDFWKRTVAKYGFIASKLADTLTEREAFDKEIELIAEYKKQGFCKVNISLGGDGVKVEKRWWGAKQSAALKGIQRPSGRSNLNYQDVISVEDLRRLYCEDQMTTPQIAEQIGVSIPTVISRLKEFQIPIRKAGRTAVKIRCLNDNAIFNSINEAARFYGIYRENIKKVLRGTYTHTNKLRFEYE